MTKSKMNHMVFLLSQGFYTSRLNCHNFGRILECYIRVQVNILSIIVTSSVIVWSDMSTFCASKIWAISKTSLRAVAFAATFMIINSLPTNGKWVKSWTWETKMTFSTSITIMQTAMLMFTSWTSMSLYSWCTSLAMDSSVPGTTVVMREVPSFAAGPTARLCQSNGYCLARTVQLPK